ncbi:ABC transporter ATP-binding protein/permease [Nocardia sp. CNY236]|uniref:ABC transporter ATP-binding protein/permease n=1 Tax=Nocardia sp. CNY236 TaxID=1169152 RepID=UPI0004125519|nr:ATP-binding cassette domain-containing protein [Nocardia sp. CNY236]
MARPPIDPRLWRYARSARSYLVISVALTLVTTGSIVVSAVLIGRVLAGVVTDSGRRTVGAWTTELAILALAVACRVLATWVQSRVAHRAGASVIAELESAVLEVGARLPFRELDTRRTELAVVVGAGLSGLRNYLVGYVPAVVLAVLVPPIVLAVIAVHDPSSGLIVVVTLPLIPVFMILIGKLTEGRAAATFAAGTRLSDQLLDLFAGMPTLRALGRETGDEHSPGESSSPARQGIGPVESRGRSAAAHTMQFRVRDLGEAVRQRTMQALRIAFLSAMVLELLATLSVALIAVSIGLRLVFGEMSLYAGLVALMLAPEVYLPLRTVGERFHAAQDGMAAADKAFAVLDSESSGHPGIVSGDHRRIPADRVSTATALAGDTTPVCAPRTECAPAARRIAAGSSAGGASIEIDDVSIRTRDGWAPAGLSATFPPGCVTVLAGPNGVGKSTIVQAMLGLIPPDRGSITVDGADLREVDTDQWWTRVGWLPQRPVLVPGTVRDNLELLGAASVNRSARHPTGADELTAACAATGFDRVLDELPDRWNTVIGPAGVGLSLGQRQCLALTRVLAAGRPVLLLDEPTAHLDAASEVPVLRALRKRAQAGATVVIVGHRRTVLASADRIVQVHHHRLAQDRP